MKKYQKTILLNLFIAIFLILPIFAVKANTTLPKLQVPIPDVSPFSLAESCADGKDKMCYPWIGEYIIGIYSYAIGIVGILATVILMFGGILWINSRGNQEKVGEAKAWIGAALSGLVLTLASFLILYIINPDLTQPKPIAVQKVGEAEFGCCETTTNGETRATRVNKPDCKGKFLKDWVVSSDGKKCLEPVLCCDRNAGETMAYSSCTGTKQLCQKHESCLRDDGVGGIWRCKQANPPEANEEYNCCVISEVEDQSKILECHFFNKSLSSPECQKRANFGESAALLGKECHLIQGCPSPSQ